MERVLMVVLNIAVAVGAIQSRSGYRHSRYKVFVVIYLEFIKKSWFMQRTQEHLSQSVLKQRQTQASEMNQIVSKKWADDTGHTPHEEEVNHMLFRRERLLTSFTSVLHISMVFFMEYGDQLSEDVLRND